MRIPDCYDPVSQEERRQAEWDRLSEGFPECGCCGHRIYPGEKIWTMGIYKEIITVCEDCKNEMDDSESTFELEVSA